MSGQNQNSLIAEALHDGLLSVRGRKILNSILRQGAEGGRFRGATLMGHLLGLGSDNLLEMKGCGPTTANEIMEWLDGYLQWVQPVSDENKEREQALLQEYDRFFSLMSLIRKQGCTPDKSAEVAAILIK